MNIGTSVNASYRTSAVVHRCTCGGASHIGSPCPNAVDVYIGDLSEYSAMVQRSGCSSLEEFQAKHPVRWKAYEVKVLLKRALGK